MFTGQDDSRSHCTFLTTAYAIIKYSVDADIQKNESSFIETKNPFKSGIFKRLGVKRDLMTKIQSR